MLNQDFLDHCLLVRLTLNVLLGRDHENAYSGWRRKSDNLVSVVSTISRGRILISSLTGKQIKLVLD